MDSHRAPDGLDTDKYRGVIQPDEYITSTIGNTSVWCRMQDGKELCRSVLDGVHDGAHYSAPEWIYWAIIASCVIGIPFILYVIYYQWKHGDEE